MPNFIRAFEKSVADLFGKDFLFRIPSYQRPYAWTSEQAAELLDDLQFARKSDGTGNSPYFLGTIVVIKGDLPTADVIDGQQRLATLTILLAVLRDLLPPELVSQVDSYIRQPGNQFEDIPDTWRLTIREQDQAIFRSYVQEIGATQTKGDPQQFESDSQARIIEVTNYYRDVLENRSREERDQLLKYIVKQCFLVVVQTSDREAAYRIFAVMNDRGLDLSPTDVLKAQIIGELAPQKRQECTEVWELLEESLGRDRFRDLFGHIVMLSHMQKRRSSLEQAFRESSAARVAPDYFIQEILEPLGESYLTLLECNYRASQNAEDINRCLRNLAKLDYSDWHPPVLLAIHRLGANSEQLLLTLRKIERLAYVMFLLRTHINSRIKRFAEVIDELTRGSPSLAGSALDLTDDERSEADTVMSGPIYPITRIRKLVLLRLDEAISDGSATYDHAVVSVEHVLPQTPRQDSDWLQHFPDRDTRRFWVHRLANLVLLSRKKNASAANLDFHEKKIKYFANGRATPFALTSQVLQTQSWTPAILEARQKVLVAQLRSVLRLDEI